MKSSNPIVKHFSVTSAYVMKQYCETCEISTLAYLIMVEPLAKNEPSFCLSLFGIANRFQAEDVVQKWNYVFLI